MGFTCTVKDYTAYLQKAADRINENKDYISDLDAITGDGDHWANMNMGFEAIIKAIPEMEAMTVSDMFKKIGMLMMSVIGGSSGVLYGGAYLSAAKAAAGKENLDAKTLCAVLEAMVVSMMERGKSEPGYKTMIDALHPAVEVFKKGLANGSDEKQLLLQVKEASTQGALATKDMEAVRGRACYQADKGVGHIDPGAMTMSYQIEELVDHILSL